MTTQPIERDPGVPAAPDDHASIWRYTDFTKFVDLLETKELFCPRVATLEDQFEGSFPVGQTVIERVAHMLPAGLAFAPDAVVEWPPGFADSWSTVRRWSVVTCWHESERESAAMWKLYAPAGAAVAIVSSVGRLRTALAHAPPLEVGFNGGLHFHLGRVKYIDYKSDRIPSKSFAAQFFHKRLSFEHEREVRAVLVRYPEAADRTGLDHHLQPPHSGIRIPVEPAQLIHTVRVAPQAPPWFARLVRSLCQRYQLPIDPEQSELDARPLY